VKNDENVYWFRSNSNLDDLGMLQGRKGQRMKYRIGQRIRLLYQPGSEFGDEGEIVCFGIFDDGSWKYGFQEDMAEYGNQIDFYTEEEMKDRVVELEDGK
jgi:hypothetical protein